MPHFPRPIALALLAGTICTAASAAPGAPSPYTPVAVTPLPAMPEGDFDQLVADLPHGRLYVSAEDGGAIDVFDLKSGALLQSGGPVGSPRKIVYDSARDHLLVADAADGSVKVLDPHLGLIARIAVGAKPDAGAIDPEARIFYVGSRDAAGTGAQISALSLDSLTIVQRFAVPATTLKGLILDRAGRRLLVSLRDRDSIGIIPLDGGAPAIWAGKGLHMNVPLALDPRHGLLFAGSRKPGKLSVLDARDGTLKQELPSTETSDSISFDAAHAMLYLSGDSGMSLYHVDAGGTVRLLSTDPMLDGKTSLFVAPLHRLYVMRRKGGNVPAALLIFDVR